MIAIFIGRKNPNRQNRANPYFGWADVRDRQVEGSGSKEQGALIGVQVAKYYLRLPQL